MTDRVTDNVKGKTVAAAHVDWGQVRMAMETGMTPSEAAEAFGVAPSAIHAKVRAYDWGGHQTRRRRNTVIDMLLKAGGGLAKAEEAEAVERDAKRLSALSAMARALREFDPRLSAQAGPPDAAADFAAARAEQEAFEAEMEQVIEAQVLARLAARGGA